MPLPFFRSLALRDLIGDKSYLDIAYYTVSIDPVDPIYKQTSLVQLPFY